MKNKGLVIFLIVLLAICVVFLSGLLFFSISGKKIKGPFGFFNTYKISTTKIYDKVYENDFKDIDIDTSAANIEIKTGSENKLVIYGEENLLSIDDANEILSLRYDSEPCHFFCFNIKSAKIVLYLKEEYNGKININNDYGDIDIEKFEHSKIQVDSAFGDTLVKGALDVVLSSSCGDIDIGEVENAEVHNNYGDINIKKITNKADIEDDCGDIEINEVDLKENSTIENNFGNIKIKKTNYIMIESIVSLGDNKFNKNNYKSDIVLNIKNDCGDIEVN